MRQAPAELAPAFFTAYPDPAKGCIGKRPVLAAAARPSKRARWGALWLVFGPLSTTFQATGSAIRQTENP